MLNSQDFERISPALKLYLLQDKNVYPLESSYFNPQNDIKLSAFDSSGLSSYRVEITDSNGKVLLENAEILTKRAKKLDVILPKVSGLKDGDVVTYNIIAKDWSNTNFFRGNRTKITKTLIINTNIPQIQIIATSQQISYGGSALIAFQARDLDKYNNDLGIERVMLSNGKNNFEAFPYINKQGYLVYVALIAWPITNTFFDGKIYVYNKANNKKEITIPIATNINYMRRNYNFKLTDSYLNRIIKRLEEYVKIPASLGNNIHKFEYFNRVIRVEDNKRIADFARFYNNDSIKKLPRFNSFAPIHNGVSSGRFGDEYTYRYEGENVSSFTRTSINLLDSDSKSVEVLSSNDAKVAFNGQIGEYGNVVVLSHFFGLNTLYGYLKASPKLPFSIESLDVIGLSGLSGFAETNSVRFATLVQGNFVNPKEWMDAEWIDKNINQVLEKAENFGIR